MSETDSILKECLELASYSPCQKLGFGAVLYSHNEEKIIAQNFNKTVDALRDICQPECVRLKIKSRTHSMIGACAHAEEQLVYTAGNMGVDLSTCEIYVAGVRPDGTPLEKTDITFTCIRCATAMYLGGLRAINVWFEEEWHPIRPEEALKQSFEYAIEAREVDSA